MESLTIIFLLVTIALSAKLVLFKHNHNKPPLPPGPNAIAFIAKNVVFKRKSLFELEQIIKSLHDIYGAIFALHFLSQPAVFIQDHVLAHQALVQNSLSLVDRPRILEPLLFLSSNSCEINSSCYGPLWRTLRRNMTSKILHNSSVNYFEFGRKSSLSLLIEMIKKEKVVSVRENFRFVMFRLLMIMCFGHELDEGVLKEALDIQYFLLLLYTRFNYFAVLPQVTKILFRKRWNEIVGVRKRQCEIFLPLIKERKEFSYVDSLLDLEIPIDNNSIRKLKNDEIVHLCHEFLTAGTDTTSVSLEWIMAELVKNQGIQNNVRDEIYRVVGDDEDIGEEKLEKMDYLKAVIMEALRLHPPAHFVLPHKAREDIILNGYYVPKNSEVHINIAQLGRNEKVWDDAMEFKPERFLKEGVLNRSVDITGSREIKMMPFGAGRRICPGYELATLHLEYFVANLVREFEWKANGGEDIDLAEAFEFTVVMKTPLSAQVRERREAQRV